MWAFCWRSFDDEPLFILSAYTDGVPDALPNGDPGHTTAHDLIGRLCRICFDTVSA
jgi:beta-lactamase class A